MTGQTNNPLTISRLARLAGIGVETIRYYQRIGLLATPPRPAHGYRTYPADSLERLHFIARAKQLDFTLKEIAELLQLGPADCQTTRELAKHKREHIQRKIRDLQAMNEILDQLIACCETNRGDDCPILASLSQAKPNEPDS